MLSLEELKLLKDIIIRTCVPVASITTSQIQKATWVLDREIELKIMNPVIKKEE